MAKLILERMELNPHNSDGVVQVAYFEGTPTMEELDEVARTAQTGADAVGGYKERRGDIVSERAGLQRWLLWPAP